MIEIILYLFLIALYIMIVGLGLFVFVFLIAGSLFVGSIGGIAVGLWKGFENYFSSLIQEIKLRK